MCLRLRLLRILLVRKVGDESRIEDMKVEEHARSSLFGGFEDFVLRGAVVLAQPHVEIHHVRFEFPFSPECDVFRAALRVPVGVTVVVEAATAVYAERRGELVAVTEVVPVILRLVEKSATARVMLVVAVVERMDVAQAIGFRADEEADIHASDTHVRECVVVTFDQNAHAIGSVVADDIHAEYVGIR